MTIPAKAWRGVFGEYRAAMTTGVTELPDAFHYAGLATVLGAAIGRSAFVYSATEIYPNQYTVLVGPSGQRKTTAIVKATELVDHASVKSLYNLNSAEGLVKALGDSPSILVVQDEFTHVFAKARQDGGSTLIPLLNRLYDVPDVTELVTKADPVRVEKPYISIFSGSPPDWLRDQLEAYHFTSGFLNRFTYYVGDDKAPISMPVRADVTKLKRFVKGLAKPGAKTREYRLDTGALKLYDEWYHSWKLATPSNEYAANLGIRLPIKVLKMGLLFAVTERSLGITRDQIEGAIEWAGYQQETMAQVFGESPLGVNREEQRFMRLLDAPMTVSMLHKKMGGRVTSATLTMMIDKLVKLERVESYKMPGDTKTWLKLRA